MKTTPQMDLIIETVRAIRPGLYPTSGMRANAGYHTLGLAVDFSSDRRRDMLEAFIELSDKKWGGGLSLGLPPAMVHLHVDARHLTNPPGWRTYFLETQLWNPDTKSCGEVFSPSCYALSTGQLALWRKTWNRARSIYK